MIVSQFQETRRFVGRLDPDHDVRAEFKTVCTDNNVSCGWITASAVLRNVEIYPFSGDGEGLADTVTIEGAVFCPTISGNISLAGDNLDIRLYSICTPLAGKRGNSKQIGGLIVSGEVRTCEFTLLSVDDATLVRQPNATGFPSWEQIQTPAELRMTSTAVRPPLGPAARPKPPPSYQSAEDDEATELIILEMKTGDFVDHPRFGVCKILHAPVDDKISIRLPTGKHVDLHLGVMKVLPPKQAGGRRVFQVEMKRKV